MGKKSATSFNLDKAISRIAKPSVFDRLVKEIDASEIPAAYVEQVLVQYYDGNVVEFDGDEIVRPIPLKKNYSNTGDRLDEFKPMRDVRVFINTEKLEQDINEMVEKLLGNLC